MKRIAIAVILSVFICTLISSALFIAFLLPHFTTYAKIGEHQDSPNQAYTASITYLFHPNDGERYLHYTVYENGNRENRYELAVVVQNTSFEVSVDQGKEQHIFWSPESKHVDMHLPRGQVLRIHIPESEKSEPLRFLAEIDPLKSW